MRLTLSVAPPFRLDRTVAVLQRLPGNPVDLWTGDAYVRAFATPAGPVVWRVSDAGAGRLSLALDGPAGGPGPWRATLGRMLGLDVDLAPFLALARSLPALAPLVPLLRGVRPPRLASLHEAFAAVVLFQQVSLASAVAMLRRLVEALSPPLDGDGLTLRPFPSAAAIADAPDALLRAAGLSAAKARALREAAAAIASGELREGELERLASASLVERLRALRGVGPWTAGLIALRYFGRLDVFPPGDVAALKALGEVGAEALVERLGPWRGMLYYLLFTRRMWRGGAPAWRDVPPAELIPARGSPPRPRRSGTPPPRRRTGGRSRGSRIPPGTGPGGGARR
jgi:DNA-3-methyladenine glycosylase II